MGEWRVQVWLENGSVYEVTESQQEDAQALAQSIVVDGFVRNHGTKYVVHPPDTIRIVKVINPGGQG